MTDQNTIKVIMNPLLYNFTNWTLALSIDESDEIIDVKYLDPTSSELTVCHWKYFLMIFYSSFLSNTLYFPMFPF